MIDILTAIIFRPSVLVMMGILGLAALALVYFSGPKALLKWAMDARVWLVIGGFATVLAVMDLREENTTLKQKVDDHELIMEAKEDAQASIAVRQRARETRDKQATHVRNATSQAAQTDGVLDATLDAIAEVQAGNLDGRQRSPDQPVVVRDKAPDGDVRP